MRFLKSHSAEKCKKGTLWDLLASIRGKVSKFEDPLETLKILEKKDSQSRKGGRKSLIVPKNWKSGPFCLGLLLYFMLEALYAFKMRYYVLMVKVHNAQKVAHTV